MTTTPATMTYRQSRKTVIGVTVALLAALVGVGIGIASDRGDDRDVQIALGLYGVLIALVIIRFARLATMASPEGLLARSFFRTRRVPWSRIQAIVIQTTVSVREQEEHQRAVVYLEDRRRLTLPGVNDRNLDALPAVAEAMRQQWMAGRGSAWQPIEAIQRAAAHRARHPSTLVLAFRWVKIGLAVMAGTWIVLILLKALPPEELRLPIGLGAAAVIAILGVVVESVRGRALPEPPEVPAHQPGGPA